MPQFTEMTRPALWSVQERRVVDSVVVGYDGSEASRRAVVHATAAAAPGGRLVLVTASTPPGDLWEPIPAVSVREADELLEEAVELCRGRDVQVETRLAHAEPVEALVDAARESAADLIVVGARGESFVARTLRGSVAEGLVTRAPCDVLVVR